MTQPKVLWLADQKDLTAAQVGERLGLSANAAAALVYRARKAVRDGIDARTSA